MVMGIGGTRRPMRDYRLHSRKERRAAKAGYRKVEVVIPMRPLKWTIQGGKIKYTRGAA